MHHTNCILALYRKAKPKNPENETDRNKTEKQIHAQILAELALYMEQVANEEKGTVFKLSELATIYKTRVQELGGHTPETIHTTKLKNRLMVQVDNLKKFKGKNDHCYLCFDENVGDVLKSFYEMDWDDEAFILAEAAKILRRNVLPLENTFDGTFNDSIQKNFIPHSLMSFVDQVLQEGKINTSQQRFRRIHINNVPIDNAKYC